MKASRTRKIAYAGLGWLMVGAFMLPFLWMLLGSFKTTVDFLSYPPVWVFQPTLENYRQVFADNAFVRYVVNSLVVASGATSNSLSVSVSAATCKCDQGQLILSHDGAIVATAALDSALARGGSVTLTGLPGGTGSTSFSPGLYYVSVRAWSSSDPNGTLRREVFPTPVDLRSGSTTSYSLTIN